LLIVADIKNTAELVTCRLDRDRDALFVVGTHSAVRSCSVLLDTQVLTQSTHTISICLMVVFTAGLHWKANGTGFIRECCLGSAA
jgi:hypothetical protein